MLHIAQFVLLMAEHVLNYLLETLVCINIIYLIVLQTKTVLFRQYSRRQRRSQDFCLGGGATRPMPLVGGGGVVAEMCRDLHKQATFAGGGGGVIAYIFRGLHKRATFAGGGGGSIAEIIS